jgi:hypothetical protein
MRQAYTKSIVPEAYGYTLSHKLWNIRLLDNHTAQD